MKIVDQPMQVTDDESRRDDQLKSLVESNLCKTSLSALSDALMKCEWQLNCSRERGVRTISSYDEEYPVRLRTIPDPPAVMFAKGDAQALHARAAAWR